MTRKLSDGIRTETAKPTVLVVGAGAIGSCCALNLQRKGFDTLLVDAGNPGEGCSFGNAGAISPGSVAPIALPGMLAKVPGWLMKPNGPLSVRWSYLPRATPWLTQWIMASRRASVETSAVALKALLNDAFEEYEHLLGGPTYSNLIRRNGQLQVWESENSSRSDNVGLELRQRYGTEIQTLTSRDIDNLEPTLAPIFSRGLFMPRHGQTMNPLRLVRTIVDLLVAEGGGFHQGTVINIEPSNNGPVTVRFEDGEQLRPDWVVLAAGAWSARLLEPLGVVVPLETERGYHVMIPDPGVALTRPVMHADQSFIATPMEDGLRIAGTVEIAGLESEPDYRRAESLLSHAQRMFPSLNDKGHRFWMGCRPSLPDSVPIIGPAPGAEKVVMAFGHGHLGITGAATTGRLVSEILAGTEPTIDPSPYRIERFSKRHLLKAAVD